MPALAALVVLLFSLEPAPAPVETPIVPTFEPSEATRQARALATLAPQRPPGSGGDEQVANRVRERFAQVPGGVVSQQEVSSSWAGREVTLRNVLLTLPGQLEELLLVVAARDSAQGAGTASSAAATAILMQLADQLGGARHRRTIVIASTSGSARGGAGVRALVEQLPAPAGIDAAVVIAQPGHEGEPPFVYPGVGGPRSTPARLLRTAGAIATAQQSRAALTGNGWTDLVRLALPFGHGEAAALHDAGVDAVAVSGGGEIPLAPGEDTAAALTQEAMLATGTSALGLVLALDEGPRDLAAAPATWLRIGDSLLPGWTIGLLAIGLVLPALLSAGDVFLRERRRNRRASRRTVPWTAERVLVPLAPLLVVYLLGLIGVVPSPGYPHDPALHPPGVEGIVTAVAITLTLILAVLLIRPFRTPLDAEPQTLASAGGLLIGAGVLGTALFNPFLALLMAPLAHLWILPARVQGSPPRSAIAAAAALLLLPLLAAGVTAAIVTGYGIETPWHLLILLVGGQVGLLPALMGCAVAAGVLCCIAAAGAEEELLPLVEPERPPLRGPSGYVGPGSLGGTPSQRPRHLH